MSESWFSDRANEKLAALTAKSPDEPKRWSDLFGLWEPRVQPTDDERCCRCGGDARDGAGGDGHFCGLHVGRDCQAPEDCGPDCAKSTPTPEPTESEGVGDE